jgi:hypothetical protein
VFSVSPIKATATPKPHLARLFEAIAAIVAIDKGRRVLVLVFDDGRLTSCETNGTVELARFDEQAAWLTARTRAA